MADVLIITSDDLLGDEKGAVDEFVRDVESGLSDFVREADILLSGASGMDVFEDDDEPPLADPEQRRRVAHLKWLLEVMQQSWWQNNPADAVVPES